jgi:hypothetical protein
MTLNKQRAGLTVAALALVAAAACSKESQPVDSSLKADLAAVSGSSLELAPTTAKAQVVVSSIEEGPQSAPAPASHAPVAKPAPRAPKAVAPRPARQRTPTSTPTPKQAVADIAPQPEPVEQAPAPTQVEQPAPAPIQRPTQQQRQPGTYKTEAEVFRQMPWIKP